MPPLTLINQLNALQPGQSLTLLPRQFQAELDEPRLETALKAARECGERCGCEVLFGYAREAFVRFTKRADLQALRQSAEVRGSTAKQRNE